MPKIVDHDAYRRELLDACIELAATRGYASLTMRELADAAGVSTGTLYHYFGGKADLFARLVERITDQLVDAVCAAVAGADGPEERLAAMLSDMTANEAWYARSHRLCLDALRLSGIEATTVMSSTMHRTTEAIADALAVDAAAARFVVVVTFGLLIERDLDGGATPFAEQAAELQGWLARLPPPRRPTAHAPRSVSSRSPWPGPRE